MNTINFKFQINKAFTLLEMLVVIGIIAILVSLGAVSYSTAQKKARDAKRKTDLSIIRNAMEQCYSINNYQYVTLPAGGVALPAPCASILTVPSDPLGGSYVCSGNCDTTGYTICPPASVGGGNLLETEDCSSKNCCVSNQQ